METHLHTCMLCEAVCGIVLETEGGSISSVRGDQEDPFSRGHLCPKAAAIPDVTGDPDRVRTPLRRTSGGWKEVSWKEALDEAGDRLAGLQRRLGRSSIGVYLGNPTVHSYSAVLSVPAFSRLLGTKARFSATSVDQLPQMLAALQMFGHQLLLFVPDVDRTSFMLMLGANPAASNGSIMTAPGIVGRLKALRARGGRLVVVDPRRTETAELADRHLPIRPGTDAALLLAILHTLFAEKLAGPSRMGRLAAFTDDVEDVERAAREFPPERVAPWTGIAAGDIRALARDFASAESAVCYGRVGTCTQEFGGLSSWLVIVLNAVTGNLDRAGGAMFTTPAVDLVGTATRLGERGSFARWRSRVRGLPEFGGELPVATLAEEIETPGDGQIRGLLTMAGNPVLSTPDGTRLERALRGLDFMVSIDLYRNETTRHAHLILPTSFGPERDHYDAVFYALAVRNAARYVPPAIEAPRGVREDGRVLLDLALSVYRHGGGKRSWKTALQARLARALGARRALDLLLRTGPHRGLSLKTLRVRHPHGIDLGPLQPRLPGLLQTPEKRVRLFPAIYRTELGRLAAALSGPTGELTLIGRRQLRSNNSWMHNVQRLVKGPIACTLLIHPEDAERRGLRAGEVVVVKSRVGQIEVPLEVTDAMAPGVVSVPHGWGHARADGDLRVASAHPGVSLNDLTDGAAVDTLSGTSVLNGVPVSVRAKA